METGVGEMGSVPIETDPSEHAGPRPGSTTGRATARKRQPQQGACGACPFLTWGTTDDRPTMLKTDRLNPHIKIYIGDSCI
jgi:hypothetical protein